MLGVGGLQQCIKTKHSNALEVQTILHHAQYAPCDVGLVVSQTQTKKQKPRLMPLHERHLQTFCEVAAHAAMFDRHQCLSIVMAVNMSWKCFCQQHGYGTSSTMLSQL